MSEEELYAKAVLFVTRDRKGSVSYIQRRLQIAYDHAAKLMKRMEREGIVSEPNYAGKREVFAADRMREDQGSVAGCADAQSALPVLARPSVRSEVSPTAQYGEQK